MTHQRLVIFEEVAKSHDHPDAETICQRVREKIPTVSLDTIYRTLWMLDSLGLITTVGPSREKVRFDGNITPHHHFVCSICGEAHDVDCPELNTVAAPDDVEGIGRVNAVHVELRGVCKRCEKQTGSRERHI